MESSLLMLQLNNFNVFSAFVKLTSDIETWKCQCFDIQVIIIIDTPPAITLLMGLFRNYNAMSCLAASFDKAL